MRTCSSTTTCATPRTVASRCHRRAAVAPTIPEPFSYRLKNKLLGPPLHTEQLEHETLGKPTALAVFASDNLSSSAYATEEILRVLVPVVGAGRVLARRADHDRACSSCSAS